jgi:hypothetical protein
LLILSFIFRIAALESAFERAGIALLSVLQAEHHQGKIIQIVKSTGNLNPADLVTTKINVSIRSHDLKGIPSDQHRGFLQKADLWNRVQRRKPGGFKKR